MTGVVHEGKPTHLLEWAERRLRSASLRVFVPSPASEHVGGMLTIWDVTVRLGYVQCVTHLRVYARSAAVKSGLKMLRHEELTWQIRCFGSFRHLRSVLHVWLVCMGVPCPLGCALLRAYTSAWP